MKRKIKKWWSTIPAVTTMRKITSNDIWRWNVSFGMKEFEHKFVFCNFILKTVILVLYLPDIFGFVNVLHSMFLFLDNDIVKFCTAGEVTAKSVYLSNEKYPYSETSTDNRSCQCTIRSGLSEGISIYAVDIMLIDEEKRCYHQFRIQDTYGIYRQITCGQEGLYGYRSVYERMVSNVTMTLQTGSKGRCFVWTQITGKLIY